MPGRSCRASCATSRHELGKQIELEMQGAETELDRQVLDLIKDPLTHMVRNSADHGLETPAERRAAGKPERGRIRLSACHEGGHIIIQVADDGRGLNIERIKAKALAQGLDQRSRDRTSCTEAQIHKFIFVPGFSTAAKVTSVSGRGVGMDVVRNNIDQIGGTIDVRSVPGVGSTFTIKNSADAGDRLGADRRGGRPAASPSRSSRSSSWCARATAASTASSASRTPPCCGCATSCCRSRVSRSCWPSRWTRRSTSGFVVVMQVGSADLRHRGRRRVPHRRNRGEADVEQAAAHRDVFAATPFWATAR